MLKGMACFDIVACKRHENENHDQKEDQNQTNKGRVGGKGGRKPMEQDEKERNEEGAWEKGGSKPMEVDKSTTKDPTLEQTSVRAQNVSGWNSLTTRNGFKTLDIDIKNMSV